MKKYCVLLLCVSLILCTSACGSSKLQDAYNLLANMSFDDMGILTAEEKAALNQMVEQREEAFQDKDLKALERLKTDWDTFRAPIDAYIWKYQSIDFFTDSEKKDLTTEETETAQLYKELIYGAYKSRDEPELEKLRDEWYNYRDTIRKSFQLYNNINQEPFSSSEKKLLTAEHTAKFQELKDKTGDALKNRDSTELTSLAKEWDTFTKNTKKDVEAAREKILSDYVSTANVTSSLTTLFSFGMITSSCSINGHKIIYTTKYNTTLNASDKEIKEALDSYLSTTSSIFQDGVKYLKEYIDDASIRVEYKNKDGNVVSYKEFK